MEKHDVLIIGGGHNGLIAAGYLVKAGLDVCVIEMRDKCGGGVLTEELTLPGFRHDTFSFFHHIIQTNPLISHDELGLKGKYGLKYIAYDPTSAFIFPDDRSLVLYRDIDKTCESISQFSKRDAEVYPRFLKACGEMSMILGEYMFAPPPAFGNMVSFLEASEEGREYLGLILGSALDVAEQWFESDEIRAAFIRSVAEVLVPPQQKGTGDFAFSFAAASIEGVIPEGGSGALTDALVSCLKDNGATIRLSCPVKAIKVTNGEANGVVLDTGEEILATRAVVSTVNVKQLFLQMCKPDEIPAGFPDKVKRISHSVCVVMKQDIALNEPPRYKAGGDADKALLTRITPFKEDILRMFEEFTYGIPQTRDLGIGIPTLADPTRAPDGKHTMFLWQHEPYNLKDGGPSRWDNIKQEIADAGLETLRKHTTNISEDNILGRLIRTPLDLKNYNPAWINGDASHIGISLSQIFANRPLPGWGHYRTPIKKLYICGACTHPGPAVSGGSRAAMPVIMEDLGIDFRKVIAK